MFERPPPQEPLTQGDLFADCPLLGIQADALPVDLIQYKVQRWTAPVIILTQACDLAQGKAERVLVARVHRAQQLVDQGLVKAAVVRDQVRRHLVFGWYFLPATT